MAFMVSHAVYFESNYVRLVIALRNQIDRNTRHLTPLMRFV